MGIEGEWLECVFFRHRVNTFHIRLTKCVGD